MNKINHGLPKILANGWELEVHTPNECQKDYGLTEAEIHEMYDEGDDKVVRMYTYRSPETGDEGARIGIEFSSGRLAVYGCQADVSDCGSDEVFVNELTDSWYNQ